MNRRSITAILFLFISSFAISQKVPVLFTNYMNYSATMNVSSPQRRYSINYLNEFKDTIDPSFHLYPYVGAVDTLSLKYPSDGTVKSGFDKGSVQITVLEKDTVEIEDWALYGNDSITFYKALPIVIINTSSGTLGIGKNMAIDLLLEAQSENGTWYSIGQHIPLKEEKFITVLKPGYVAVTAGFLYEGDFTTNLRYRLGENVSNTFRGTIKRKWLK